MTAIELYEFLSERIPASLSCEWDNDGLMCCPDPKRKVRKVLLTLDATEKAVSHAIRHGYDVILTHHPMIFRPIGGITDPKHIALVREGITVMSFHTRLDRLDGGVNDVLAKALGLTVESRFGENELGVIGTLPSHVPTADFVMKAKATLEAPYAEAVLSDLPTYRVAVVGGSGKDYLDAAREAGADTYVTGDISYNAMTDAAETGMNVITLGHYYTEQPVLSYLRELVTEFDPAIACRIYACNVISLL